MIRPLKLRMKAAQDQVLRDEGGKLPLFLLGHSMGGLVAALWVLEQRALAASHKYQVTRLRLWCEQQLCECISVAEVCNVLCQARAREARARGGHDLILVRRCAAMLEGTLFAEGVFDPEV